VPTRSRLSLWLPPVALMALIFFLSAQPDLSTGLGLLDLIGRKLVHAGEYALLCALWWRALRTVVAPRAGLVAAIAIAIGYAITDELHQTLVPARMGSPIDVAIDAAGAGLAALAIRRRTAARGASRRGGENVRAPAESAEATR
jgi:hypothetical protein